MNNPNLLEVSFLVNSHLIVYRKLLTNFENLIIYDTTNKPEEGDTPTTSIYRHYHFSDYYKKYAEIYRLISRESVYSGEYDTIVSGNFQNIDRFSTAIDEIFLTQVNDWRVEIGQFLFQKGGAYNNIDVLNDVVQEFINQIIFLRICEDRNLPLYRRLKDTAVNKQELRESLTKTIKEADKRYNSGLFAGENIVFDLNNEIIEKIIMSLYYPQTPYMFNIIEPGILGKIYENFLTQSLVIRDKQITLALKDEYIYRSVVSTPLEIVKYMVRNSLSKICNNKTPEEILKIRIADIACGSGVFLEEALQFLFDYCIEWYESHDKKHLIEINGGRMKLPLIEKKRILTNCIYGIDIDIHAVEVCRFSLLIKLLEDETKASVVECDPILPNLDINIMNGNSLLDRMDFEMDSLSGSELRKIKPFSFDEINNGERFDVILGNPPYVKTEDIHSLETNKEFLAYKKKFKSAYKQFDKYFLFVERAFDLLKGDGILCYIIPNKFYKIGAGQELRKLVKNHIIDIIDFGDLQLFPDKTIYSAIITLSKSIKTKFRYINANSLAAVLAEENTEVIELDQSNLDIAPWRLSTDISFLRMVANLEKYSINLGDVVTIFNGIQTSAERPPIYWFSDDEIVAKLENEFIIRKFNKEYHIEKAILKPYFKPTKADEKGLNTYSILKTNKQIIFPYDKQGKLYSIEEMKKTYNGTYEYLCDCYDFLVPKSLNNGKGRDVPNATKDTWYQYGRTQALTAFIDTPKLIVRVLSKEPMYAYDEDNMLIASGGTAGYVAIAAEKNCMYDLHYIQAWLNHPYTEKMLRMMGSEFEGGFTARGTYLLKRIPFVELDFSHLSQKNIYDQVVDDSKRIYSLNQEIILKGDKATLKSINKEIVRLKKRIESNIGRIYELDIDNNQVKV